ncbi:type II toxin-antitoxin system VapC family toxin [Pyrodictium abyssi]|uniref:Ribonuclease VapC n=1 Tax=Pyrodictium abyssi TaxID=54256 RepID=A0ABN6ZSV9_9CREN|nr:type II toxin-antitoxin system VapC family toxin [Pyrodictium abyssi]
MIVVDASALAKYVLKEEGWRGIARYLVAERSVTLDHALKETLNAVWKAAVIHRVISRTVALEKYRVLTRLVEGRVITVEDEEAYLEKALEIAIDTGLTVYDALYVAQAASHRARLLTCDRKQAEAAEKLGINTILVL